MRHEENEQISQESSDSGTRGGSAPRVSANCLGIVFFRAGYQLQPFKLVCSHMCMHVCMFMFMFMFMYTFMFMFVLMFMFVFVFVFVFVFAIGGDFNMSALSTVGDGFSDPEFSAPGNSFPWGLVRWKSSIVSALGSSSCPSAHMSGLWIHMAATSLTMQRWASDFVINPLTCLCSYISVPPTCLAPTASCAANVHNKEEWNAGITNMTVRGEDVHDRDPEFCEMQILRHAKYVGTMICPNGHLHRWTALRKKRIQRVMKINASTKSLVERLCDFKIYAISVLSFIGSVCAPDKATLKAENRALQCSTARPYNAITSSLLEVGSTCGLGPDLVGIHYVSLAARYRVAACLSTLRRGPEKVNDARGHNCTPLFALSPAWEHEFLFPSMTFHTTNASDIICRLDRDDTLDEVPQNQIQKVATSLLLDKLRAQDFAGPLSSRASRVLGPISRHRIADILHHMKRVSCASRPGLLVGFLRILCNGLCTARRFHTAENDHTCRIGCPD